ncbi:MAG: isoprenylcysteine carboxylmethyltransferase family protein [Gemmatimonadota bacterium]|nr:isoprenylcysteine carboxylmethyltransferase family protein [Gemmatimonadota bacterium]
MPLREEWERSGNWLFRWRSYLPMLMAGPVIWSQLRHTPPEHSGLTEPWVAGCFGVALLGLLIRAVVIGYAPAGTSGRNTHDGQVALRLNTTGFYSVARHPLYLGNLFMWMGVALLARSWWVAVLMVLVFWLYYERIMFAEEEYLRRTFGDLFVKWAQRTPAFLPDFSRWCAPALPFSFRNVLRREYSGLLAIVVSFAILNTLANSRSEGSITVDDVDLAMLGATTALYLLLRTLKHRTRMLHVEGR